MKPYLTTAPKLGVMTIVTVAFWHALFAVLIFYQPEPVLFPKINTADQYARMTQAGVVYGLCACVCWISSSLLMIWLRWSVRLGAAAAGAFLVRSIIPMSNYIEFAIYFGGMTVSQAALFGASRVPRWQIRSAEQVESTGQFSIGDIIFGTTAIAVLLGLALQFKPPISDGESFWSVLAAIWICLPVISALVATSSTMRQISVMVRMLLAATLIIVLGSLGIASLEMAMLDEVIAAATTEPPLLWLFTTLYTVLVGVNALCILTLGLAGRMDAKRSRGIEEGLGSQ